MKSKVFLLAAVCLVVACVGGGKRTVEVDKEKLKAHTMDALVVPGGIDPLDINFENKFHLVGAKWQPAQAGPGAQVTITYYWRCDEKIEDGWQLFTHARYASNDGERTTNYDNVGPLREGEGQPLGPSRWEKGKFYADEQTFNVPTDLVSPELELMVGIYKGNSRLRVTSGPHDDNRAIAAKIKTGATGKTTAPVRGGVPETSIKKLAKGMAITVDGKGDDAAWGQATTIGPFVDVSTGGPNTNFPVKGNVKVTWDNANVYAFFEARVAEFYTGFTDAKAQPKDFTAAGQPKLWTKDTVEWMIDPDGDGDMRDYYELQFNPQNKVFKSQFDTLQQPNGGPNGPFGHEDWDPKLTSVTQVKKDEKGATLGYDVEIAIPWAAFGKAKQSPPKNGDTWRMNFYAMKDNSGVSWSPIMGKGNFHHGPQFGRVKWVDGDAPALTSASDAGASDAGLRLALPPGLGSALRPRVAAPR